MHSKGPSGEIIIHGYFDSPFHQEVRGQGHQSRGSFRQIEPSCKFSHVNLPRLIWVESPLQQVRSDLDLVQHNHIMRLQYDCSGLVQEPEPHWDLVSISTYKLKQIFFWWVVLKLFSSLQC